MSSPGTDGRRELSAQLVVISGPIASGKSTLAAELVRLLRADGFSVALTDLDTVAEMALPTLPDWTWAHRIHAQVVGAWVATDIDIVIDEGTSSSEEVQQVLAQVPPDVEVFHVVLTADYDHSLARAQADPGRGVSKGPDFLRAAHASFARHLPELPCNLRLDVEGRDPWELARQVLGRL